VGGAGEGGGNLLFVPFQWGEKEDWLWALILHRISKNPSKPKKRGKIQIGLQIQNRNKKPPSVNSLMVFLMANGRSGKGNWKKQKAINQRIKGDPTGRFYHK